MLRHTAAFLAFILAGCASTPPITTGVITVDRPIAIRCIKAADIPEWPTAPAIADDADIEQLAAWAKLRISQLRHYAAQLRAALTACATEE